MTNWYEQEGDRKGSVSVKLEKLVKEKSAVINKVKKNRGEWRGAIRRQEVLFGTFCFYIPMGKPRNLSIRQGVCWGRGRQWTLAFKKDWRQEKKGTTEDEMVGWHHRLNGHEFEQVPGVSDGQGSLACCSPSGCRESDTAEQLNWTELRQWILGLNPGLKPW